MKVKNFIIFLVFVAAIFFGSALAVEARNTIINCPTKGGGQKCENIGVGWYYCGGQCQQQSPQADPGEPWSLDCRTCQWQCAAPNIICDGKCQTKFEKSGKPCDSPKGGKYDDCGKCLCPAGQENCEGTCKNEKGKPCQINGRPGTNTDACGKNCAATPRPAVSFGPYSKQEEVLDRPAIWLNQLGGGDLLKLSKGDEERFKVSNTGDLYLSNEKAIRIDKAGGVGELNIGNWAVNAQGIAMNIFGNLRVGAADFSRKLTVYGDLQTTKKISAESIDVEERIITRQLTVMSLQNCLLGVKGDGELECRTVALEEKDPIFANWQKNFQETDPQFTTWRNQAQPELKNLKVTENLLVNNQLVCLGDGRNCPAMKDADWQAWKTNLDRALDGNLNLNNGTLVVKEMKVNGGLACTTTNNRCAGAIYTAGAGLLIQDSKISLADSYLSGAAYDERFIKKGEAIAGLLTADDLKINNLKNCALVKTDMEGKLACTSLEVGEPQFTAWKDDPKLNKLEVTGDLKVSGCFGPVFTAVTDTTYDGSRGGYKNVNGICAIQHQGSHVCTTAEILNSIHCGKELPGSGFAWISNGPPAYLAKANDCDGWTSTGADVYGAMWEFTPTGGKGHLTGCNTTRLFACCK